MLITYLQELEIQDRIYTMSPGTMLVGVAKQNDGDNRPYDNVVIMGSSQEEET